jgi:hypothetical protein
MLRRVAAFLIPIYAYTSPLPRLLPMPTAASYVANRRLRATSKTIFSNRFFIAEVLSPSTENYDRGIESFREYLIVIKIGVAWGTTSRQDDASWILREYSGHGSSVAIGLLGVKNLP